MVENCQFEPTTAAGADQIIRLELIHYIASGTRAFWSGTHRTGADFGFTVD
jgi:hypothetical protein